METAIWEEKIDQWIEEHRQELINDIVDQVREGINRRAKREKK